MGLFNRKTEQSVEEGSKKRFSVYSLVSTLAIIVLFVAVGLIAFAFTGYFHFSPNFILLLGILFIISGAAVLALPWIRRLQNKQNKIVSWVFLGLLILFALLWIVSLILLFHNIISANGSVEDGTIIFTINFVKYTLLFTVQYAVASLIANTIMKYRKNMIAFQVIMYLSNLFVDFYLTVVLLSLQFNTSSILTINFDAISWLLQPIMYTLFILALMYMVIANAITKRIERKRGRYVTEGDPLPDEVFGGKEDVKPTTKNDSAKEKLAELKSMLDQNLITEEEYNKKKEDILNNM